MTTIDLTKPVQTRSGRKVRILAHDRKGQTLYPIVALVTDEDGDEVVECFRSDGGWLATGENDQDLINLPEEKRTYFAIYDDGEAQHAASLESLKSTWAVGSCVDMWVGVYIALVTIDGKVVRVEVLE